MAANHTENYNLNLWEPSDDFLRTEFNENTQKIDAAIKAEGDARTAGDAGLATAIAQKATIVVGSYYGTFPSTDSFRTITLGVRPKLVLVVSDRSFTQEIGMACGTGTMNKNMLEITDTGFIVGSKNDASPSLNLNGNNYFYLAVI